MNRTDLIAALADLDDVISRLSDAGADTTALSRERFKLTPRERLSLPPATNAELRRKASEHFAKAREHTSEAVRRLRREV